MYSRLALDGVRRNRRAYLPYLIACAGMAAVFYIMAYLTRSAVIAAALDSDSALFMLGLGKAVTAVFAAAFLFYTHSFLIRRRRREFGLYNMLGMTKRNIARVLFREELFSLAVTLAAGTVFGILISKLAELLLVNLIGAEIAYTFSVEPAAIAETAILFTAIFALQYLFARLQIRRSGAIELLKSEAAGEKPPRANWALAIPGALLLAAGYGIAVTVTDPYSALQSFFIAVLLVIAGTYLTMIAGSVALCRALQKNRRYYYKLNHFVSVSQMAHRMRRSGAGLATICILSTMVLVCVSSTASLYFGREDSLKSRYPMQFQIEKKYQGGMTAAEAGALLDSVREAAGDEAVGLRAFRLSRVYGALSDGAIHFDPDAMNGLTMNADLRCFAFVSAEDYNAAYGTDFAPGRGEAVIYAEGRDYAGTELPFTDIAPLRIVGTAERGVDDSRSTVSIVPTMLVIVDSFDPLLADLAERRDAYGNPVLESRWICTFDTELDADGQIALFDAMLDALWERFGDKALSVDCCEANRRDFYDTFGALFFIGIMLSVVFMFAAVLIIYYKQISEAQEDRARYEIMQRIGMSDREIRRSVNSQLLIVFFLPLAGAFAHICFAFPVIRLLLRAFNLNNAPLFAAVTGIAFLVYAAAYAVTCRLSLRSAG